MELYSDTYYIQRIQEGDTGAFACLLDRYSNPVYSLVLRIVRNREDAEELAQDVFLKVFRKLGTFHGDSAFSTWIYRIAYNTAVSETRKKKREFLAIDDSVLENVSEENLAGMFGKSEAEGQLEQLDAALGQLPPDERALIGLFYMEEKSIDDIASVTGLSASNVKTRLHRIRKKLFVLFTQEEEMA